MEKEPTTLQEAILYFSNPDNCREYLVARRWPDGVDVPALRPSNVLFLEKYNRWQCREKHDAPQFTLKDWNHLRGFSHRSGQVAHAMWQVVNCKNGISSLRGSPRHRRHSENRMVHGSPHSVRARHGTGRQAVRPSRSGRNLHRRQGAQHARRQTRSGASPALAAKTRPPSWASWNAAARSRTGRGPEPQEENTSGGSSQAR